MEIREAQEKLNQFIGNIGKVIIGKEDVIKNVTICLVAGGHALLEDVPGTGNTMLAKSIAKSLAAECSRIQFTPDLLPADITGLNVYNRAKEEFTFIPGPVMTNVLLADEINRATPRTQSALLEAMQEEQVTVDGETRKLNDPFFVIATQNPVETAGTFPLPEAELDRFMMELTIGHLSVEEEIALLNRFEKDEPIDSLQSVMTKEELAEIRGLLDAVSIHADLVKYIATLSNATREDAGIYMGVSPRGSLFLLKAAKASALLNGRDYVIPDDIKKLILPVCLHRILFVNRKDRSSREEYLASIVNNIEMPSENFVTQ